jgi:hypothetical protein
VAVAVLTFSSLVFFAEKVSTCKSILDEKFPDYFIQQLQFYPTITILSNNYNFIQQLQFYPTITILSNNYNFIQQLQFYIQQLHFFQRFPFFIQRFHFFIQQITIFYPTITDQILDNIFI